MTQNMDELLRVTALLRERALESYRRDLAEESRLQAEQARIDGLRQATFAEADSLDARRLLGADTLWQGWLAQRRGEINQGIAMARARQAHSAAAARLAFARDEAAKEVARHEAAERRSALLAEEDSRLDALSRLSSYDPER
ncbi:hypothetical protein [Salipiger abyssi]|uniref:hypothetical protein n=1 Tax=Salipiger abyssi TaxID=1250539 RepID=UPI001A8FE508|nr:hypothetical protein [Salipiger abyssi]MBN9886117.1 hypothetical protein [Salipiger abyssi]